MKNCLILLGWYSVLLGVAVLSPNSFAQKEAGREIWNRYKTVYSVQNFNRYSTTYVMITPAGADPGEVLRSYTLSRSEERYIYSMRSEEPGGTFLFDYSWDGSTFVRFGRPAIAEGEKLGNTNVWIGEVPHDEHRLEYLHKHLGVFDADDTRAQYDVVAFDRSTGELTLGFGSTSLQKIHFTDLANLRYDKVETLHLDGTVASTRIVTDWRNFGGRHLPGSSTTVLANGEVASQFRLIEFKDDFVDESNDFIVTIPYEDHIILYDDRIKEYLRATLLDEQGFRRKEYLSAWSEAFARKMARRVGEDLVATLPAEFSTVAETAPAEAKPDSIDEVTKIEENPEDVASSPVDPSAFEVTSTIGFVFLAAALFGYLFFMRRRK